jgi:hypothetical protein
LDETPLKVKIREEFPEKDTIYNVPKLRECKAILGLYSGIVEVDHQDTYINNHLSAAVTGT